MVIKYAKSALETVKEKLGFGSKTDFEQIDSTIDNIFQKESEIDQEFANINEKFESKTERAYEKMLDSEDQEYSLEEESIRDTRVQVNRGVQGFGANLFSDQDFIDIDADNVLDYVEGLGEELVSRKSELEKNNNALEEFGSATVGELLDAASDQNSYTKSVVKSASVEGMLKQKSSNLKAESEALEEELVETVEKYTRDIYNEAQELSNRLRGTARSEEGEFDILNNIAKSRGKLLRKGGSTTSINQESLLETSGEAIGAQSQLVKQYLNKLDSYRENLIQLTDTAQQYLDPEQMNIFSERVEALNEGLEGLSNVVNENNYDSVEEALTSTVERGLSGDEPRPEQYFTFDTDSPYSKNETRNDTGEALI